MSTRMSDYERWQLIMSVFMETHSQVCFLLNKALFGNLCVFSNSTNSPTRAQVFFRKPTPPEQGTDCEGDAMYGKMRIKRNDIEKGWCREQRRGERRGSQGERSCQSLGDIKHIAAL